MCGNVVQTGEQLVVSGGRDTFFVTPPASGSLYMSARTSARDLRAGDTVRVSLSSDRQPYLANMINIYRKDDGAATADSDPEGEKKSVSEASKKPKKARKRRIATKSKAAPASAAERYFRLGQNLLKNGKRESAVRYFDKAKKEDASKEMAKRIADALNEE